DRFVRSFKDDPVKALVKATLAMTVPTAVLYAMNRDNPRYQELPENTKDNFFLIPIDGGEKFIRIAKPREFGVLFSGLPERLMRQ
ncbi:LPD38 domain-containing protein, partial [Paenibacillus dendritiformis]